MTGRIAGLALVLMATAPVLAQDMSHIAAPNYHVVLENKRVRVLDYVARPGVGMCGAGIHSHPPHVTVLLSPSLVRVTLPGGASQVIEGKTGDSFYEPAVTHVVENISGHEAHAVLIELKEPGAL